MIACCNLLPGLTASTHLPRPRVRPLRTRGPARPAQVLAKLRGRGGKIDEKGTSIGWNISKRTFRAMIDSALGLDPDDNSEEAKAKRRLRGRADFDGIAFVAKIAVEPNNDPRYPDPAMVRRWHADPFGFLRPWNEVPAIMGSAPPAMRPSTGTGVITFLMG
jgi:hypothetical protein